MTDRSAEECAGHAGADSPPAGSGARLRRIDTRTLLGADREVLLVHRDSEYRLRVTSSGKLILTK